MSRQVRFRIWVPGDEGNPGYMELPPEPDAINVDPAVLDLNGRVLALQGEDLATNTAKPAAEYPDGSVLMQWTGLQDKDGVDVYEGDLFVVRNGRTGQEQRVEVTFNCELAAFTVIGFKDGRQLECPLDGWFDESADLDPDMSGSYQVAGNIYENRES
jgi:uncharacterized phage protein (TIGR01671 family)